ncbi:hypothetical protein [Pseudomonas putida]|uniref:Uncharacterized protein n=1 Tax=Pseudomonas putida TaxID=303 RepID=A0A8I1JKL8_PSEPU|nr:hypothetical protein [Pseudomonas putida]MBI6885173.1 hypothetical protein [Pseudomonas putida]
MQISKPAKYLDDYLDSRIRHPEIFGNLNDLISRVNEVERVIGEFSPLLNSNPFVTAVHIVAEGQVEFGDSLDRFRLFNACLSHLSMAPVDEISPQSLRVFSKIAEGRSDDIEKFKVAKLVTNLMLRADELEGADRAALKNACKDTAKALRPHGFFPTEYERDIAARASRTHGKELVELLGFDSKNIPSIRSLPASRQPDPTAFAL